jgi:preprotein translocase subunit SecE
VARERERAKDRKRRAREGDGGDEPNLHADEQPINASGEVDEFEAALVRDGDDEPAEDAELERAAEAAGLEHSRPAAPERAASGGPRFVQFLRASWAELQRVQWPDRRQVGQATAVVVGFVVIAGAYLGLADAAAKWVVDQII